jgi:uncharacterized protein (TIGR04255 family)
VKVTRIASRYINRIVIAPGDSFDKTFLTTFMIGPDLPQLVAGFLLRMVIPFDDEGAAAIVTQSLDGSGTGCVLDLDTFSERIEGIPREEIWARLDQLREVKNRLFFGSLTPEALEKFK